MNKRKTKLLGLLFSLGIVQILFANMLSPNIEGNRKPSILIGTNVQQQITGTVTDEDGVPLSGASVMVKGTTNGVVADFDGNFTIDVDSGSILVVSYVGFETKEITIGLQNKLNIVLIAGNALEEVVVTALGIRKEKRRVGYATQEVNGESLQKAIAPNVVESLTGKISGVTVTSNGSDFFSDPQIYLRGEKPLIVVDGVPQPNSDFWNLASDDIENITVLKGAAASALYGSLGANGAIQITMKSGKGVDGTVISFNSSTTFQGGFLRIPHGQTQYGPGNTGRYEFGTGAAGGGGVNDFDYSVWGPKFDGRLVKQFDSPIDPVTGERIPTPWISRGEDNLKNFMEVGMVTSNNVTVQSSSDKGSFVISNTYKYAKASTPGQRLDINTFRLRGNLILSDAVDIDGSLQYNYQYSDNRIRGTYGPTSPIYLLSIWGGANFDVRNFDGDNIWLPGKEGIKQNFVENWRYNNPYILSHYWKKPWTKNDILTYLKANFKLSDKVSASVRSTLNSYSLTDNEEISKDIYNYDIPDRGGRFRYNATRYFENNTDFLLSYNESFFNDEIQLNGTLGANQRYVRLERENASTTQLIIPEIFTLNNSVDQVTPSSSKRYKGVYSAYSALDFSYKNQLFFGMTGRVDKSSSLPEANDTFFYPSIYLSAVVSDMINLPEPISYLKLRTAYANVGGDQIGNSSDPLDDTYNAVSSYDTGRNRNFPTASFPGTLDNPNIRPSFTNSFEYGFEMKLFKGRFGIDFSYYENEFGPQIFTQPFSSASGYDGIRLNGRTTERRGMDFSINATPVRTDNFNWSMIVNFDKNKEYLISLPPLPDGTPQENEGRTKVGALIGDYWYSEWERSPDGQLIIQSSGTPKVTDFPVNQGNTQADFTASVNNSLTYKNLSLNFLIDGRFGGTTYDRYERDLWRAGGHPDAIHPERELSNIAYVNGGDAKTMQIAGVAIVSGEATYDPDGNIVTDTRVFEPSNYKVDYQTWAGGYKAAWQNVLIEKTFAKLREVSLTYMLPSKLLDKTFVDSASISLIGRNLLYWTKDDTFGDLDTYTVSTGDTQLQLPSQRSYGFNLNFQF
ncbi:SusC/RagA family TonB-linked outer membrane protein [Arenibacter sp. TNZ]|uniref:SusC/RagA family TonB-linked outer membrane protein n=1 Tax=Arenibacter TaxID=178469 RepID=UPI000CD3E563|nr:MULTISPECIES: SusC/RagA family TonB-linked outer membrane protein [Arenibacter]MCM4170697.1 SusC/RagA family TonB-linked outer membrane protein [Arenibacter sp. TNZ]